ncbi:MAG: adenosine kinase [Gemmataceae bacterium]|nr:adenosine kinase [Gemmataceae bacterium]
MKPFQVCGLGNALVDILLELSEPEFAGLGFERGTMRLVEADEQKQLLDQFHSKDARLVSGGSVANSVIALSQLGGRGAFLGCVGDDRYGFHYKSEFDDLKIDFGNPVLVGATTGTCLSIITPDAERTMRTCLGVASHLAEAHVDAQRVTDSEWLFVEGYVLANPATGQGAVREAVRVARSARTKIALTCSEAFIVEVFGDAFHAALAEADLLFCNATEAMAVTKTTDVPAAFASMKSKVRNAVVTDGANGAYIRHEGVEEHVPAFPCQPKDLTGAGDMFAGAYLYGLAQGIAPGRAARAANFLAMKVITQIGARLHHGTREFWDSAIAG